MSEIVVIVAHPNLSQSRVMHSTGQSGNVFSPPYRNFVEPWRAVQYVPLWAQGAPAEVLNIKPAQADAEDVLIPFVDGVWAITAAMLAYNLFWQALLSQFETVSMVHLARTGGDYSRVRLWGSVGFVVSVLSLGPLLDLLGILPLPWLVGVMWIGMIVASFLVPETPVVPHDPDVPLTGFGTVLWRPEVMALLIACLCSQMSFAPYYNFFTLFLERHGHARSLSGVLWAVAVVAEIKAAFDALDNAKRSEAIRRNVPVAFAIGLSAVCTILYEGLPIAVVFQRMTSGMTVFSFLAIPFFIWTGDLMMRGRIATDGHGITHGLHA